MAAMTTRIFVISDLHMGGAPAQDGKPAFQICSETGRLRLTAFLDWVATQKRPGDADVHLVIAGDIVDFLAESRPKGFNAFTADDGEAEKKLGAIMDDTSEVWVALRRMAGAGVALTLMLGNHDLELSLPRPRRLLLDRIGPGRVEFIYDNQAFTLGPVVVEHGNRYDDWNAVPHDQLREARSAISRGQPSSFEPLPGSDMVVNLVNPLKKNLAFVDLLKPETAALLPFLAFLDPSRFRDTITTLKNRVRAARIRYNKGQQPLASDFVGAPRGAPVPVDSLDVQLSSGNPQDDELIALAETIAGGGDAAMAGAIGTFFERWGKRLSEEYREIQLGLLYRALRAFSGSNDRAFDVTQEDEGYLKAATESAVRGFKVIVYGHTHLPKRITLRGRTAIDGRAVGDGALYLNSGTWADLMAVPSAVLDEKDEVAARKRLKEFADDMAANRVEHWRRTIPTFVSIESDGDHVLDAQVMLLGNDGNSQPLTTELLRSRMRGEP